MKDLIVQWCCWAWRRCMQLSSECVIGFDLSALIDMCSVNGCSMSQLSCCPQSPMPVAIQSLPNWTQMFAGTLAKNPHLMHNLTSPPHNDHTTNNDDDDVRCSEVNTNKLRSEIIDNMTQYCDRQQPKCPQQQVRLTSVTLHYATRVLFMTCADLFQWRMYRGPSFGWRTDAVPHGNLDVTTYCIMATQLPIYLFEHVKHGTQNIQNDCHQLLSDNFRVHQIRFRPGLCPWHRWGSLQRSLRPLAGLRGRNRERGDRGKGM